MTDIAQIDLSGIPDAEVKPSLLAFDEFAPSEIDLSGIPDAKPERPHELRQGKSETLWDNFSSVWGNKTPEESAKATNSLLFSEMLNISPEKAYDLHDEISTQMRNKAPGEKIVTDIKGVKGSAKAGVESSIYGMIKNAKVPEPFESAKQLDIWVNGLIQMGIDLPVFLYGMVMGGAGGPAGAMAGGFGLMAGLRKVITDRYSKGKIKTFGEFQDRTIGAIKETVKGQVVGALTGAAGGMTPAGFKAASELATMTITGKLIEGHIPKAKDFIDNAGIFLAIWGGARGFQAITTRKSSLVATRKALEDVYNETGTTPKDIIERAATKTKEELSEDANVVIRKIGEEIKAEKKIEVGEEKTPEGPAKTEAPRPAEPEAVKPTLKQAYETVRERQNMGSHVPIADVMKEMGIKDVKNIEPLIRQGLSDGSIKGSKASWTLGEAHPSLTPEIKAATIGTGDYKISDIAVKGEIAEKGKVDIVEEVSETSIKNAVVDIEREARGAEPIETPIEPTGKDRAGRIEDAIKEVDAGAVDPMRLAEEINNQVDIGETPKNATEKVNYQLLYGKKKIQNELKQLEEDIAEGKTPELIERRTVLEDALDANEKATKAIGTAESHALSSRKDMMEEDYSVSAMVQRAREDGIEVTPELRGKFREISGKIEKAQKDLEVGVEAIAKENIEKTIEQIKNTEAKAQRKQKRTYKSEELDAEFSGLVNELNKFTRGLHAGVDPMAAKVFAEMAINRIRRGIVKAEDIVDAIYTAVKNAGIEYSKRDIRDAISQYGKTKEMSKEEINVQLREAKRQMQLISALEDAQKGKPPLRSGLQRDAASDRVRELRREVNQAMRESGIQKAPTPEQQWKSSLDAVKTRLKNQIADFTKQIETGAKTPKKTGIKYDAEANALKAIRDDLKKTIIDIEGKPKLSDEQKVKMAVEAVKKSIDEYTRRIKENDLMPKPKISTTPRTPELKALRGVRDSLKETYKTMQKEAKPKKSEEEIRLGAWRTRTENKIADLERRISEGDYTTKAKKPPVEPVTTKDIKAQVELNKLKQKYFNLKLKNQIASLGIVGKIKYDIGQVLVLIKAIKSAYDVSAPGRQGMLAILSHPIKGFKNVIEMFKALGSEEAAFRIEESIKERPNYKLYQRGKLELTKRGGRLREMEESFQSRWAEAIPGIPASNRAYIAFLNLMRADLFDSVLKGVHWENGVITDVGLKAIGDYANQSTGRGTIGPKYADAVAGLGKILWAPKLVLSRFQMLAGKSMWGGNAATRMAIAKEYGRILGSLATIYAVSSQIPGVTIEIDPRSSDFGKIKIGNRRIDPLAGLSQITVFMSRIITGQTKTARGRIKPITEDVPFGGMTTWDVITNFLRSKLTPVLGTAVNLVSGRNMIGEKVTMYDIPEETLVPLAFQDVYDSMVEDGIPNGLALAILAEFGIGIQIYDPNKRRVKSR